MSKDPTDDIVQRILNQIQSGLQEASPKMGKQRRNNRTSDKDTIEAVGPDTEDEITQSKEQEQGKYKPGQSNRGT